MEKYLFFLLFNLAIISGLYYLQVHKFDHHLRRIKQEMQEMEDLVVAIIEEFEATVVTPQREPEPDQFEVTGKPSSTNSQSLTADDNVFSNRQPGTYRLAPASIISDPKNQKVIELAKEGRTIAEIAEELAIGPGKVRLIIDLYQKIQQPSETGKV
ncbi:MAG TPA: helix-turn-helix domain-containing protein [Bacillota bacterium]